MAKSPSPSIANVLVRPSTLAAPVSKTGYNGKVPDRTQATPPLTVAQGGTIDRTTEAYTYITKVGGNRGAPEILYNGERPWARVKLLLETAGQVVVGTKANLLPLTSGKGRMLITDKEMIFELAQSTRLYIIASAVNRVGVTIEPIAWAQEILNAASGIVKR